MGRDSKYCNKKTIKIKDLREAKEEYKNDQNVGLLVMHALKRTKGRVIK